MIEAVSATATSRNGHSTNPVGDGRLRQEEPPPRASLPGRLLRALADQVTQRVPPADLDERDPDYIREALPGMWLLSSLWFRGEVRGLGNIPEEGPVLLVGNHSGGNLTPDTTVFTLAFSAYFGVERPFYQLAHNLVLSMPGLGFLRKFGTVAASPASAEKALRSGAAVLVYPGGDHEVHRPSWQGSRVDFAGRKGFLRLALEHDVPIVPVVSIGGQETALFLGQGRRIARLLRLDRTLRLKVFPAQVGPPYGVTVMDLPGRIPLPAKITVRALPKIDLRKRLGPEPDVEEAYELVTATMQRALDKLDQERRLPVVG